MRCSDRQMSWQICKFDERGWADQGIQVKEGLANLQGAELTPVKLSRSFLHCGLCDISLSQLTGLKFVRNASLATIEALQKSLSRHLRVRENRNEKLLYGQQPLKSVITRHPSPHPASCFG